MDKANLQEVHERAVQKMNAIAAQACDTDWPDPMAVFTDVQDMGDPRERAF